MTRLLPLMALLCAAAAAAPAATDAAPVLSDAWIAQPPPGTSVAAGYFELDNRSAEEICVIAVAVSGFAHTELHETVRDGDRMSMRMRERIEVAAGSRLRLAPGGLHLMLFRPSAPLSLGQRLTVELTLDDGRTLRTSALVRDARAAPPTSPHTAHR